MLREEILDPGEKKASSARQRREVWARRTGATARDKAGKAEFRLQLYRYFWKIDWKKTLLIEEKNGASPQQRRKKTLSGVNLGVEPRFG